MMNIITTILLGGVKFGMTFPLAIMQFKFSFLETILWINVGGVLGIYFFAYLSEIVNNWINKLIQNRKLRKNQYRSRQGSHPGNPGITDPGNRKKRIFTKRNRKIIRIKQRWGLVGIAMSTPVLFSIPIGVFLVVRYYSRVKTRFLVLIGANLVWSLFYTSFYMFWNDLLFVN